MPKCLVISHSCDLDASFSICKLILITYLSPNSLFAIGIGWKMMFLQPDNGSEKKWISSIFCHTTCAKGMDVWLLCTRRAQPAEKDSIHFGFSVGWRMIEDILQIKNKGLPLAEATLLVSKSLQCFLAAKIAWICRNCNDENQLALTSCTGIIKTTFCPVSSILSM